MRLTCPSSHARFLAALARPAVDYNHLMELTCCCPRSCITRHASLARFQPSPGRSFVMGNVCELHCLPLQHQPRSLYEVLDSDPAMAC